MTAITGAMTAETRAMVGRELRALLRQPAYLAITLVQPVVWLLLFGALFHSVAEVPGFGAESYVDFLTPGVVVMCALFSSAWSGMGMHEDIDRGVMDRFLVTPVHRSALVGGRLVHQAAVTAVQSLVIVAIGLLVGAHVPSGMVGVAVLVLASILLACCFAALSNALALVVRNEETIIAASQFVILPLSFMSTIFMPAALLPGWIGAIAEVNPVNWAVVAGRDAISTSPDWAGVSVRLGALLVLAICCAGVATRAFRSYQRSL